MKNLKSFKGFVLLLVCFFAAFILKAELVSAKSYQYQPGSVEKQYKDTSVISFSYDYITMFEKNDIVVQSEEGFNGVFYSGRSIVVNINHYNHWFPFTKDDDYVDIYMYNESKLLFATGIASFDNKADSYTLNTEGLYKIVYGFEGSVEHVVYVCISKELHEFSIEGDPKYNNSSVFANFTFKMNIKDGYDLRDYTFYYAFGTNPVGLNYRKIDNIFTQAEKQSTQPINNISKSISVKINDSDASSSGQKKYLFVKVVYGDEERVTKTINEYILSSKIQALVYLVDENNTIINEKASYRYGDVIRFKIVYNAPVTYSDLKFSKDGLTFIDLEAKTDASQLEVYVKENVKNFGDIDGSISFKTGGSTNPLVNYNGENVAVEVISKALFDIDVTTPQISVLDEGEGTGRKDYSVRISVEEKNLEEILYYVAKCKKSQDGICRDTFDNENEQIVSLGAAINPTIRIDNSFGMYDGANLALFVKAIDKAGNLQEIVKYGYVIDNIIVPNGLENELFVEEDIIDEGTVVGKSLMIYVPKEYRVNNVQYRFTSKAEEACTKVGIVNDVIAFKCVEVSGYDYRTNVTIKFGDELGNTEQYVTNFTYSMTKPGNVEVDGKLFYFYNDKDYEIEFKTYNYMPEQSNLIFFNGDVFSKFAEELNLDKAPQLSGLKKSVIYMKDQQEIVIVSNVGNELYLPNVESLISILGAEEFNACSVTKCDVDIYLKYEYYIDGVAQTRLMKINYIDGTNKFVVENSTYMNVVEVGDSFSYYEHKYASYENILINSQNVTKKRKIVFVDTNGTTNEVSDVNTKVLGKYFVSDYFEYNSIGSFPLNYVVEIVDTQAPVIRLNGKNRVAVNLGESFEDPFVTAYDNYDQNLVIKTNSEPLLDLTKTGEYVISYWCEDSSGNVSEVITRTIVVKEAMDLKTYLLAGGISLATILIMVVTVLIEVKKERKRK